MNFKDTKTNVLFDAHANKVKQCEYVCDALDHLDKVPGAENIMLDLEELRDKLRVERDEMANEILDRITKGEP